MPKRSSTVKAAKPVGRPSTYSHAIVSRICERLASGESLRKIVLDDDMPAMSTVFLWLFKHPDFSEQYARARENGGEAWLEDMLRISDNATSQNVNVARLQVDTRKWAMSKIMPKKYGEKQQLEHTGRVYNVTVTE